MRIEISQETETRLTEEARKQGISVEALVERLICEGGVTPQVAGAVPELPVWHLGDTGPLHRREIYDDGR